MSTRNNEEPVKEQAQKKDPPVMSIFLKQLCLIALIGVFAVGLGLSSKPEIGWKLLGWALIALFAWLAIRLLFFVKTK